jgi:hypothetical protein
VASDWVAARRQADAVTPAVWVNPARGDNGGRGRGNGSLQGVAPAADPAPPGVTASR